MSVRLILDTSALRAYIASDLRAIELAELIGNVDENEDTCGIPALCLLAAAMGAEPPDRGRLLKFAAGASGTHCHPAGIGARRCLDRGPARTNAR